MIITAIFQRVFQSFSMLAGTGGKYRPNGRNIDLYKLDDCVREAGLAESCSYRRVGNPRWQEVYEDG